MEEKERYELTDTDCIFDTERDIVVSDVCDVVANADIITDLLNQQDKRIKELENENKQLKQQVEFYKEENKINKKDCDYYFDEYTLCKRKIKDLEQEKQQLKQQLHDLPNKIVEEIRKEIEFPLYVHPDFDEFECLFDIDKLLDTILKKYGGEDESNND